MSVNGIYLKDEFYLKALKGVKKWWNDNCKKEFKFHQKEMEVRKILLEKFRDDETVIMTDEESKDGKEKEFVFAFYALPFDFQIKCLNGLKRWWNKNCKIQYKIDKYTTQKEFAEKCLNEFYENYSIYMESYLSKDGIAKNFYPTCVK